MKRANGTFYRAVPADFVNKCAATRNNALPFQSEPGMMEEFNIAEAAYLAELRKLIEVANAEEQARGKESTRQPQAAPVNEPNAMWRWRVCVIDRAMLLSSESAEPARDIVTAAFAGCVWKCSACHTVEKDDVGDVPDRFHLPHGTRRSGCTLRRRVMRVPVAGDIDAAGDPNAVVSGNVIQKPLQRRRPARAPGQAAMQADRQHAWPFRTFAV